jgi:hypothetical protein
MAPAEIQQQLAHCTCSTGYTRPNPLVPDFIATSGVMLMAELCSAHWLLDAIASYQPQCKQDPMLRQMQFWRLTVADNKGVLICERDEGDVAITQEIPFTDFPLPEIRVWVEPSEGYMVALLPSEH